MFGFKALVTVETS